MVITFQDIHDAVDEAARTMRKAEIMARRTAPILVGRLRNCEKQDLAKLKRELRKFNGHTLKWKD